MIFVKVNGAEYAAEISGRVCDRDWDGRESKAITTEALTYAEAAALFVDDTPWSIVERSGETESQWDNAEFSIAGDVTDHRDGRITIKMGKPTDLELAYEQLYG